MDIGDNCAAKIQNRRKVKKNGFIEVKLRSQKKDKTTYDKNDFLAIASIAYGAKNFAPNVEEYLSKKDAKQNERLLLPPLWRLLKKNRKHPLIVALECLRIIESSYRQCECYGFARKLKIAHYDQDNLKKLKRALRRLKIHNYYLSHLYHLSYEYSHDCNEMTDVSVSKVLYSIRSQLCLKHLKGCKGSR